MSDEPKRDEPQFSHNMVPSARLNNVAIAFGVADEGTITFGMPTAPKQFAARIGKFRHHIKSYRKHGERRGVVRRREWLTAGVEWER